MIADNRAGRYPVIVFFEPPAPPVSYPHPLITEVLYAVPTEKAAGGDVTRCDANKDGSRDATGDEFIELFNPHDKPIELGGYTLRDSAGVESAGKPVEKGKKAPPGVGFKFPSLTLQPGDVVVVFNGNKQKWVGPVGDTAKAPVAKNDRFDSAWVFTMRATSSRAGFSNGGDFVLLSAPDGTPVERVRWGADPTKPVPKDAAIIEDAPAASGCSVQREGLTAGFVPHTEVDGLPFSPGRFRVGASTEPVPAMTPADAPLEKKTAPK